MLPHWGPLVWDNAVRDIAIAHLPCSWLQGRIEARQHITAGTRNEAAAKEQRTLEAQRTGQMAGVATPRGARFLSDLGLLVVSCEHGEMRQSPAGIYIYDDSGTTEVPLTETRGAHAPELDELYDALGACPRINH